MSRIEDALARLDAAVARVERASAKAEPAGAGLELAAELRKTREDYAALKGRTDGVAARLDTAIGRLKGVLGEVVD